MSRSYFRASELQQKKTTTSIKQENIILYAVVVIRFIIHWTVVENVFYESTSFIIMLVDNIGGGGV